MTVSLQRRLTIIQNTCVHVCMCVHLSGAVATSMLCPHLMLQHRDRQSRPAHSLKDFLTHSYFCDSRTKRGGPRGREVKVAEFQRS